MTRIKAGHERCVDCGTDYIGVVARFCAPVCPVCQAIEDEQYRVGAEAIDDDQPRPWSRQAMKERLGISRGNEDV